MSPQSRSLPQSCPPLSLPCPGGFTGSYISSQTIFTCRAQIDNRLVGVVVSPHPFSYLCSCPGLPYESLGWSKIQYVEGGRP